MKHRMWDGDQLPPPRQYQAATDTPQDALDAATAYRKGDARAAQAAEPEPKPPEVSLPTSVQDMTDEQLEHLMELHDDKKK
jgi:hypothetical protein